jgi:hypothetical protein
VLEQRNSVRASFGNLWVKEVNGDYLFAFKVLNISEEGLFLEKKLCASDNEPFSTLSFTLPNGKFLRNLTARIVRQDKNGSAYEFMNLSEENRLELKRYLVSSQLKGTA